MIMTRIQVGPILALFLGTGVVSAQDSSSAKVDGLIFADAIKAAPGNALSARTLVQNPTPVKGLLSWSIETRRIRNRFSVTALSPDGKLIATGGIDGIIRLWDVETGKLVRALVGHDYYVYGLAFSAGGKYLASGGSFDGTARIWEVATGQPLKKFTGHPSYVSQVAWSSDGKKLIGEGGVSGDISVWTISTGQKTGKYSVGQYVLSLSADSVGERFAVVTHDAAVVIYSLAKGKAERNVGQAADKYHRVAWSPDGKTLAAGCAKGTFLYDPNTGKAMATLDSTGTALDWSADSSKLATASGDGTVKLWNAADGTLLHKVAASVNTVHLLPGKESFIAGDTVALATYPWADGKRASHHDITGVVWPVWTPGRPVVTGIQTPTLSLWDSATGHLRHKLEGHSSSITAFVWSPDGKAIATASYDKTVRVYDPASGKQTHKLEKHTAPVLSLAWSPDGKEIASGGQDKKVIIWDAKTGEDKHTLTDHAAAIACLAFSPGGGTLADGGDDGKVYTWSRPGWKAAKPLITPNQTSAMSLAWTTDGKTLAVGDVNGTALLWSPAKAKLLAEVPTVGSPPHINSMVFIGKNETLATARGNHSMVLFSASTQKAGHTMQTMAPAQHVVWAAPHLAVSAHDRTCRFFEPISGKLKGVLVAEPDQIVAISMDGHYRADGPTADGLIYVVQTATGQDALTPAEFAATYKWKNEPDKTRFAGK